MSTEINKSDIIKLCQKLGCCSACCLRYTGIKNSTAYENAPESITKLLQPDSEDATKMDFPDVQPETNGGSDTGDNDEPECKKSKIAVCVSCLGILQEHFWKESMDMVKNTLEEKRYECKTFACGLSSPISALLREKAITLRLADTFKGYDPNSLTALKEAWKWSFAAKLAPHVAMTLDSGSVAPLLVTLNMEYPQDLQELEILKTLSPDHFESRRKQVKRFTVEFTRRSVEQALEHVSFEALAAAEGWRDMPAADSAAKCVSVVCVHTPAYLGGRYIKLSRELPQTPWVVNGERMMETSVQEIIFEPIAKAYGFTQEETDYRMKFMSAGREDVDVRCLGDGRPFAIEITDPRRELNKEELSNICEQISKCGRIIVKKLVPVTREDLVQLKKGEETKCKTYEAICIKLGHAEGDNVTNGTPPTVTEQDIQNINSYRNTPEGDEARVLIRQKTPIRVLHRRPLLTRLRRIYELEASAVPGHPQLVRLRVRTEAGTYVKEWCHGELRRSSPALAAALRARADILALDVAAVHLAWPLSCRSPDADNKPY